MMKSFRANSYLFGGNAPYVEELYENYLNNPSSVPETWRAYFDNMQAVPAADGSSDTRDVAHAPIVQVVRGTRQGRPAAAAAHGRRRPVGAQAGLRRPADRRLSHRSARATRTWIRSSAANGPTIPELEPAFYDFSEGDHAHIYSAANTFFGFEAAPLRDILQALRDTYCGTIGAEYMHITDPAVKRWIQERLEATRGRFSFDAGKKKHILERLTAAEGLERYLHTKYVGQKRFSLEGGESFIPLLDELVEQAGASRHPGDGHRHGPPRPAERAGQHPGQDAQGPVRRVRGQARRGAAAAATSSTTTGSRSDVTTPGGPVHLSLAFNPSHLEIVNPVVEGSAQGAPGPPRRQGRHAGGVRSWSTATPRSPARAS